jgi:hypothetical protein
MAAGQFYILDDILWYDDGSGFKSKGNTGGLTNGKPVNVKVLAYFAGVQVDPTTKKPLGTQPTSTTQAVAQGTGGQAGVLQAAASPVPALTTSPDGGSIRYPADIGTGTSDYMIFEFFDYLPPFFSKSLSDISLAAYNTSANQENLKKADGYPQLIIYMPEGVSVSYKANWDGKKFGNIAAGVLAAAGDMTRGDLAGSLRKLGNTVSSTAQRAPAQAGAAAVSAIIGGITGDSVGPNDIFSSIGGQILNPNAELIFGGHDLRTFTFTYKLVPFNETEAKNIFGAGGIIETFKKAMLPSFGGTIQQNSGSALTNVASGANQNVGFIKNPKIVQPYFMFGNSSHPYLPKLKPCTVTDFDVNYTADGVYASNSLGYPASAEISISFIETKLIYSEDIGSGF